MTGTLSTELYRRFFWAGLFLLLVFLLGTTGYWFIAGTRQSLIDCLYMTFITVSTIGYGEIIDMSHNPGGRVFTMFIALSGIGVITYILSNFTAFIVEGQLKEVFRRRKMDKEIGKLRDHFIVCGAEGAGFYVINELVETKRPYVVVDAERKKIEKLLEAFPEPVFLEGDATESSTLVEAGIGQAKGLFAVTTDDNQNLVISLTAKQVSPNVRVVARCQDLRNVGKIKKAGADAVVSPTYIGGLRMASEMVRPAVATFLDTMLRDKEKRFRIEEIPLAASFGGKTVSALQLRRYRNTLLMAVKTKGDLVYNPDDDYFLKPEDVLILMTTPEERSALERELG